MPKISIEKMILKYSNFFFSFCSVSVKPFSLFAIQELNSFDWHSISWGEKKFTPLMLHRKKKIYIFVVQWRQTTYSSANQMVPRRHHPPSRTYFETPPNADAEHEETKKALPFLPKRQM